MGEIDLYQVASYLRHLIASIEKVPSFMERQEVILRIGEDTKSINMAVLCGNSPFFLRTFDKVGSDNIVDIKGIEYPLLKHMVAFLNSGILGCEDFESVYSLYCAASRYEIKKLKEICSQYLSFRLNIKNFSKVLLVSTKHGDIQLKNQAISYFKREAVYILQTDEWNDLMLYDLALGLEVTAAWLQPKK